MQFKSFITKNTTKNLFESIQNDEVLMEGIVDFIGKYVAQIKNKDDLSTLDISQLAVMMTALQILGDKDLRDSITKDDVGIDAADTKQVYNLLQNVKAEGSQESGVKKVINGIVQLAKTKLKANVDTLALLKSDDETEKKNVINMISKMYSNLQQSMNKMKSSIGKDTDIGKIGDTSTGGKLPQLESAVDIKMAADLLSKTGEDLDVRTLRSTIRYLLRDWEDGIEAVDVSMLKSEKEKDYHSEMVDIKRALEELLKKIDKAIH